MCDDEGCLDDEMQAKHFVRIHNVEQEVASIFVVCNTPFAICLDFPGLK